MALFGDEWPPRPPWQSRDYKMVVSRMSPGVVRRSSSRIRSRRHLHFPACFAAEDRLEERRIRLLVAQSLSFSDRAILTTFVSDSKCLHSPSKVCCLSRPVPDAALQQRSKGTSS